MALSGLLGPGSALAAGPVQVFADFASAAGESGVREAQLWIDGQDVSGAATASPIRISYALPGDFPTGTHEARVVVVDSLGRSHEKIWTFEVLEVRPEVVAFFTDRLTIELDPLPRQTLAGRQRLSGTSLPGVEIELRREGQLVARTDTSPTGRFSVEVELGLGDNELILTALRPWTGEEGRELRLRLERLSSGGPAIDPRDVSDVPGGGGRGGRDAPDAPGDRGLPDRELPEWVIITKPSDGDSVVGDHVTVLGRAPAGWQVTLRVNGAPRGSDQANPAGHFTMPNARLDEGSNELIAEAEEPGTGRRLSSQAVVIEAASGRQGLAFTTPLRRNQTVRESSWRLAGRAAPGAELEVEVNGRLVVTESAGRDGRFALIVPLESGLNRIVVEAFDGGSGRSERSPVLSIRRVGSARRGRQLAVGLPPLERQELPGRGSPGRLRPLR